MAKWQRSFFQPVLPLGEDGRRVTGSKEHIALSRMAAGEGMVLLKNEKNILPIRKGTKVALFGKGTVDYVKGGGGSGDVTVEYIRNLYEGMKIKEDEGKVEVFDKLAKYYEKDIQKQYADGAVPGMTVEPELPDELLNEAREYTDTAVITICRFSGEGWDRKCEAAQDGYVLDGEEKRNSELSAKIFENGDFCLTNAENAMVEKVKKAFPHVIVVMNVGGIVDTKWFRDCDEIQSVLMALQDVYEMDIWRRNRWKFLPMKELRTRLKKLLMEAGFTQAELAEMVENCKDNIRRLERNKFINPTYQLHHDFTEFFEKPVEEILGYEEI